ncbi:hypothetical protein DLAC_08503 [Tieghemostelium lacteum]|uniref:F-box domain-containing protein n=1 Tax=Tieghemostelium lacteum TaxID=361077 RepID=A0A151Z7J7_TIELA|nr:hypothetical protein DLAC_08503 [Tieghemostelium lacteum]|eukprot:KYQ89931.1 hypothetical protein DLAC_08503 [Tieghemostelium lacteum]
MERIHNYVFPNYLIQEILSKLFYSLSNERKAQLVKIISLVSKDWNALLHEKIEAYEISVCGITTIESQVKGSNKTLSINFRIDDSTIHHLKNEIFLKEHAHQITTIQNEFLMPFSLFQVPLFSKFVNLKSIQLKCRNLNELIQFSDNFKNAGQPQFLKLVDTVILILDDNDYFNPITKLSDTMSQFTQLESWILTRYLVSWNKVLSESLNSMPSLTSLNVTIVIDLLTEAPHQAFFNIIGESKLKKANITLQTIPVNLNTIINSLNLNNTITDYIVNRGIIIKPKRSEITPIHNSTIRSLYIDSNVRGLHKTLSMHAYWCVPSKLGIIRIKKKVITPNCLNNLKLYHQNAIKCILQVPIPHKSHPQPLLELTQLLPNLENISLNFDIRIRDQNQHMSAALESLITSKLVRLNIGTLENPLEFYKLIQSNNRYLRLISIGSISNFNIKQFTQSMCYNTTLENVTLYKINDTNRETTDEFIDSLCAILNTSKSLKNFELHHPSKDYSKEKILKLQQTIQNNLPRITNLLLPINDPSFESFLLKNLIN